MCDVIKNVSPYPLLVLPMLSRARVKEAHWLKKTLVDRDRARVFAVAGGRACVARRGALHKIARAAVHSARLPGGSAPRSFAVRARSAVALSLCRCRQSLESVVFRLGELHVDCGVPEEDRSTEKKKNIKKLVLVKKRNESMRSNSN